MLGHLLAAGSAHRLQDRAGRDRAIEQALELARRSVAARSARKRKRAQRARAAEAARAAQQQQFEARERQRAEERRQAGAHERKRAEEQRRERTPGAPQAEPALDPYSVLGIGPSATAGEVRAAYRTMMAQYHPDKVAHLGPELRELAHRKSQEITRAYRTLASG